VNAALGGAVPRRNSGLGAAEKALRDWYIEWSTIARAANRTLIGGSTKAPRTPLA
jgi:hypothetical protein